MDELVAINCTSVGASHVRIGKVCQDYSLSDSRPGYSFAVVCDGHGGDNYFRSADGSRFAARAAQDCIDELMQDLGTDDVPVKPEPMLVQLEKSIIAKWNASVWEHFEENPFTEGELGSVCETRRQRLLAGKSIESTYGTTLIAVVWTRAYWFGIQIGDGKCVRIKADGSFDQPIPPNDKCFLNTTTSICDENAIEDFRHCFSTEVPVALFCGSDGIDDSFICDEQLYKLYETVARSLAKDEPDAARAELEDYLPRLSAKGSGDDVSIAGLVDRGAALVVLAGADTPGAAESGAVMPQVQGCLDESAGQEAALPSSELLEEGDADARSEGILSRVGEAMISESPVDAVSQSVAESPGDESEPLGANSAEHCAHCGRPIEASYKFCPECGAPLKAV